MIKLGLAASALVLALGIVGASASSSGQAVKDHIDEQNELFNHDNGVYGAPTGRDMGIPYRGPLTANDYQLPDKQWRSTENPGG